MNQKDINQTEWDNDDNWGGPKWGAVKYSQRHGPQLQGVDSLEIL
jgi:hypothetical protein